MLAYPRNIYLMQLVSRWAKLNVRCRAGILPAGGQDVRATDLQTNSTALLTMALSFWDNRAATFLCLR